MVRPVVLVQTKLGNTNVQTIVVTQADDRYELHNDSCLLDLKTAHGHLSDSGRFQLDQRPPDRRICDNHHHCPESNVPSRKRG